MIMEQKDKIVLENGGIYTIPNFLSDEECEYYSNIIKNPPSSSTPFTATGGFSNNKWIEPELSNIFYEKLKKYISDDIITNKEFPNILGANNLIMTGNYVPGQQFNIHTDTGLYFNYHKKEKSKWTLLIYINDNYEGGNTVFFDDNFTVTKTIIPEKGKALLFDIDLWHKGDVVIKGNKLWIGCEIISNFN
jgi:hypothetical protein